MMSRQQERALKGNPRLRPNGREYFWIALVILIAGTVLYMPAMSGPFLFDDLAQPYGHRIPPSNFIGGWLSIVRPLLMTSFWLNFRLSGSHPESYHVFNLLCHLLNSLLVFFIVERLFTLAPKRPMGSAVGRDRLLAIFAALLFLVHPLQTEAVSYVASRSETLVACFLLSAYLIFLHRAGTRMGWNAALAIAALFAMAAATKETAVALVPLIVLTDWFFSMGGVRKNWRLYSLLGGGTLAASAGVFLVLKDARSAGFGVQGVNWYEYFFTQLRALLVYLRLYVLPVGQTIDHDFPISRTIFEHGSWFALLALVAGLAVVVHRRKSWGLISFGILAWITLMAPTSSVVPIRDPLVEHRMYLPILGLIVASAGLAASVRINWRELILGLVVLLGALSGATYYRNAMWGEPVRLWQEAVRASPEKGRPYLNLANIYMARGNCREASREFAGAPKEWRPDYYAMVSWGMAEGCLANYDREVSLLRRAFPLVHATWEETPAAAEAKLEMLIGWTLLKKGDWHGSIVALERALKLDPKLDMAYAYRGRWKQHDNNFSEAMEDYQRALALNAQNQVARVWMASLFQPQHPTTTPVAGGN